MVHRKPSPPAVPYVSPISPRRRTQPIYPNTPPEEVYSQSVFATHYISERDREKNAKKSAKKRAKFEQKYEERETERERRRVARLVRIPDSMLHKWSKNATQVTNSNQIDVDGISSRDTVNDEHMSQSSQIREQNLVNANANIISSRDNLRLSQIQSRERAQNWVNANILSPRDNRRYDSYGETNSTQSTILSNEENDNAYGGMNSTQFSMFDERNRVDANGLLIEIQRENLHYDCVDAYTQPVRANPIDETECIFSQPNYGFEGFDMMIW